jgi:hypothetical protein
MTLNHPTMLHPMKTGLAGLLVALLAGPTLSAEISPRRAVIMPLKLELPRIPVTFSEPFYPLQSVQWNTEGRGAPGGSSRNRGVYMLCGGFTGVMKFPERETKLTDQLATLGDAYLKCRTARVCQLALAVRASDYPEGWFGDWVQDGFMVHRREDLSEDRLRALFALLAECVTAPQEEVYWFDEREPEESAAGYRREAQFASEWTIEFIGGAPLRLDLDPRDNRLLVEAGDRWDSYELDATRARQLQEMLALK